MENNCFYLCMSYLFNISTGNLQVYIYTYSLSLTLIASFIFFQPYYLALLISLLFLFSWNESPMYSCQLCLGIPRFIRFSIFFPSPFYNWDFFHYTFLCFSFFFLPFLCFFLLLFFLSTNIGNLVKGYKRERLKKSRRKDRSTAKWKTMSI